MDSRGAPSLIVAISLVLFGFTLGSIWAAIEAAPKVVLESPAQIRVLLGSIVALVAAAIACLRIITRMNFKASQNRARIDDQRNAQTPKALSTNNGLAIKKSRLNLREATGSLPAAMTPTAKLRLFREILHHAGQVIDCQARFAMSADARAVYVATAFSAFGATFLGAGLAAYASDAACSGAYCAGLLFAAGFLFYAVGRALWSARSRQFYAPGIAPEGWKDELESDLLDHLIDLADLFDSRIKNNETVLSENATAFNHAIIVGSAAPIVGALVFFIAAGLDVTCK
jgi:hypothetical protein